MRLLRTKEERWLRDDRPWQPNGAETFVPATAKKALCLLMAKLCGFSRRPSECESIRREFYVRAKAKFTFPAVPTGIKNARLAWDFRKSGLTEQARPRLPWPDSADAFRRLEKGQSSLFQLALMVNARPGSEVVAVTSSWIRGRFEMTQLTTCNCSR